MLSSTHAPPRPSTKPITKPTKRAITTRLFSFNTYLPATLSHYALKCLEEEFSEVRIDPVQYPRAHRAQIGFLETLRDFLIIPYGCALPCGSSWADRTGAV